MCAGMSSNYYCVFVYEGAIKSIKTLLCVCRSERGPPDTGHLQLIKALLWLYSGSFKSVFQFQRSQAAPMPLGCPLGLFFSFSNTHAQHYADTCRCVFPDSLFFPLMQFVWATGNASPATRDAGNAGGHARRIGAAVSGRQGPLDTSLE